MVVGRFTAIGRRRGNTLAMMAVGLALVIRLFAITGEFDYSNKQLLIGLNPITPGTDKVTWHATSVDTHKTQGSFTFTLSP